MLVVGGVCNECERREGKSVRFEKNTGRSEGMYVLKKR